jgi:thiol-disulfide isomerase/thioredoxin
MLVNVWAQWCEPCRQEAPFLAEIAAEYETKVAMLGIDFNDPRPELAIEFAQVASWTYPQVADQDKAISAPLQLSTLPQTLLVDAGGRVVHRHAGPFESTDQIRDLLRSRLGVTP